KTSERAQLAMRRRAALDLPATATRPPYTPAPPPTPHPQDQYRKVPILNFFIKSRTTLFKSLHACYNLIKQ
ncbi:hypothetical protein, partial [Pseudomonas sp. S60]|uniref:hypothetical protein n=1 Tax=Pseudomonas sp. S60 TaxID=211124 RepID=UPI001F482166